MSHTHQLILLAASWMLFFLIHSLTASIPLKRWVAARRPSWMPLYRLSFNTLSVVTIAPALWFTLSFEGPSLWGFSGAWGWLANGLALTAGIALLWSMRYYDGAEFLGLRQLRERVQAVEDQERLRISPIHRYVRHPWYSLSLVLIWTRDMNTAFLLSAVAMTLYFIIGSRFEDQKLIRYYGVAYQSYRTQVPGLFPRPWRALSGEQAASLEAMAAVQRDPNPVGDPRQ